MQLSTIFQLYHGTQFWWRKPEYQKKTTDTGKLYHNVVSSTPCLSGIRTCNVSGYRHWLHR